MKKRFIILGMVLVSLLVSGCFDIQDRARASSFGNTEEEAEVVDYVTSKHGDLTEFGGEPRFLELTMTSQLLNFIPVDSVLKYSKNEPEFNVWFVYDNFNNDEIEIEWKHIDTDHVIHTFTSQTGENFGRASFVLEEPESGWPEGEYMVTIKGLGIEDSIYFEVIDGETVSEPTGFFDGAGIGAVTDGDGIEGTWEVSILDEGSYGVTEYPDEYGEKKYLKFEDGQMKDYYIGADGKYVESVIDYSAEDGILTLGDEYDGVQDTYLITNGQLEIEIEEGGETSTLSAERTLEDHSDYSGVGQELQDEVQENQFDDESHSTDEQPGHEPTGNCMSGALSTSREGSTWNPMEIGLGEQINAVHPKGASQNMNFAVEVEPDKTYTLEFWDVNPNYEDISEFAQKVTFAVSEGMYDEWFIEEEIGKGEDSITIEASSSTGCMFIYVGSHASLHEEIPFNLKVS